MASYTNLTRTVLEAAERWLRRLRRGRHDVQEISVEQIEQQLRLAVDHVMAEAALYDYAIASRALRQTCGDAFEATFLVRAYRASLPRAGISALLDTTSMTPWRRISPISAHLPGGQILGPSFDYTLRLLDEELPPPAEEHATHAAPVPIPRAFQSLVDDGLLALPAS
jgi:alpha-D-ribose 1-methylphosphonate 5-triphosphate synthase subunit PhnI